MVIDDDEQVGEPRYLPTPEEIAALCRLIRESWTPDEECRRRAWSIPRPVYLDKRVRAHD